MSFIKPQEARELMRRVAAQPKIFIFGVDRAVDNSVLAMFTKVPRDDRGTKSFGQAHVYLNDIPGVGKTGLMTHLACAIGAKYSRINGRSDQMPFDIVGGPILDRASGRYLMVLGPIHTNIFLFDEINRTPPKGQGVLLSALEEGFVSLNVFNVAQARMDAQPFSLYPISDKPDEKRMYFWTMATANPIESEGTYPLSEAEKERFTFSFRMGIPPREEEKKIRLDSVYRPHAPLRVEKVMDLEDVLDISQMIVETVPMTESASEYRLRLIENSRPFRPDLNEKRRKKSFATPELIKFIDEFVEIGNSPRRNFHIEAAARTYAFWSGHERVTVDDVKAVAPLTMAHTILLRPIARASNITSPKVVGKLIAETQVPTP